ERSRATSGTRLRSMRRARERSRRGGRSKPSPHHQTRDRKMAEKTLDDLFLDTLKDIYYAERQIVKTLPKMAKAAQSTTLKAGFEQHLQETEVHVERLEQIFELIDKPARGK